MTATQIMPANFASHVAGMMPDLMPMEVSHGALYQNATIAFGRPGIDVQKPLPALIDLSFAHGGTPEHISQPGADRIPGNEVVEKDLHVSSFERGMADTAAASNLVNRYMNAICSGVAELAVGARDNEISRVVKLIEVDTGDPGYMTTLGMFCMCFGLSAWRIKAVQFLEEGANLYLNGRNFCAAAMAYELAVETAEGLLTKDVGSENLEFLRGAAQKMRAKAGSAWRASLNTDNGVNTIKVRLFRGLYNAWWNPDHTDMAGLFTKLAQISNFDKNALASADNYVRAAWALTDRKDTASVEWERVSNALIAGLTVWSEHPDRKIHTEMLMALIDKAQEYAIQK